MSAWVSALALSVSVALAPVATVPPVADDESAAADPSAPKLPSTSPADDETATPVADSPQPSPSLDDALYEEALDRYVEGQELFVQRQYLDAGAAFRRSYAAVATGRTLYAVGLSYEKGGDMVQALEAYRRYLDLPDCPAPEEHCAARRDEVRGIVAKLRTKVAELSIEVDDGVELLGIEIGDRIVPPEDFPIVLAPGHYEIRERGYGPSQVRIREIDVEAGQVFSLLIVDFDAQPKRPSNEVSEPGPPSRPSNRLTEEERRRRLKIAFYSSAGATVAAGIATGVVGGLTQRYYNAYEGRCTGVCPEEDYPLGAEQRFERLKPVTNVLVGVTAGLGIATVVLGLFAFSGKQGRGARASVTRVTPTPGGVRVRF